MTASAASDIGLLEPTLAAQQRGTTSKLIPCNTLFALPYPCERIARSCSGSPPETKLLLSPSCFLLFGFTFNTNSNQTLPKLPQNHHEAHRNPQVLQWDLQSAREGLHWNPRSTNPTKEPEQDSMNQRLLDVHSHAGKSKGMKNPAFRSLEGTNYQANDSATELKFTAA